MLILSTAADQTLEAGQSLTFNVLRQTGRSEIARNNSGTMFLAPGGLYRIEYQANVTGGTAALPVELGISFAGSSLPETESIYTPAVASAVGHISGATYVATVFPCGSYAVTVTNTGANPIVVSQNATLLATRVG